MKFKTEASAKHIHLSKYDYYSLFQTEPLIKSELSVPGEFVLEQKVYIISGEPLSVLYPFREQSQIEISNGEAYKMGLRFPRRDSGDLKDAKTLLVGSNERPGLIEVATINPKPHIHCPSTEKPRFVDLIYGDVTFHKVKMRPHPSIFDSYFVHLNLDEYNALYFPMDFPYIRELDG